MYDFIEELSLRDLIKNDGVIIGASDGEMNLVDAVYFISEIEGEHTDKKIIDIYAGWN